MQSLYTLLSTTPATSFIDDLINPVSPLRSLIELIVALLTIGGAIAAIVTFFRKIWNKIFAPHRVFKDYVDRVYSKENRKAIAKYYIDTRAQDIDPCEFDEIRENNGNYISQRLIPFFRDEAFKSSSQGKYYLVLGDSGMGKTTFLLRLYQECLYNRSLRKRAAVKLVPLSQSNCLQTIEKIDDQEKTILLLDALDENGEAIKDYVSFFERLLRVTDGFNKVVITCRTQFFPNRATEPVETGRIRVGTGNKKEEIVKKYISPFSDEEVRLYLKKQFRFSRKKRRQAYKIVTKVPVLMARPVILNWINFLCDSTEEFQYSFQIYNAIIDKWIERESIGHTSRSLFDLSRAIAHYMYINNATSMSSTKVEEIAAQKGIQLEPIIAKSRSLLNRNGNGEYKFAHRSFLEYFIVFRLFEKMQIPSDLTSLFKLTGVKRFFYEMLLDSAQRTDPKDYEKNIRYFETIKRFIRMDNLLDFIGNKNVAYSADNSETGFTIHASLYFKESSLYDQQHVLYISNETYADISKSHTIHLKRQNNLSVTLTITSHTGPSHPLTRIKVTSDILNIR